MIAMNKKEKHAIHPGGGELDLYLTGMGRPDFSNPPTYNVDLCRNRPYIMSKNKRNMRVIRLSRPYYCLKSYYEQFRSDFNSFLTEIKLHFRVFFNFPPTFMGFWLKSYPCLENFRAKNPPIWAAHTRTQIVLSTPPGPSTHITLLDNQILNVWSFGQGLSTVKTPLM